LITKKTKPEITEEKKYEPKPTPAMTFFSENKSKYEMVMEDGVVMLLLDDAKEMSKVRKEIGKQNFSYGMRVKRAV